MTNSQKVGKVGQVGALIPNVLCIVNKGTILQYQTSTITT